MEGPSFYCAYLGFSPISKPPTNISVLQNPVRDLYFKYRKTPASGRSASLKLTQQGVLVIIYENGEVKAEIFFEFSSVNFVEAVKFISVKSSSEKKPKALFVPVDESRPAVSEKHSFLVEKTFHFLVSSTHPPLVVCIVRRPMGVKALDCHVFALDTVENALHITALISSAQLPPGAPVARGDGGEGRGKPGFDRGVRGDVIRTEYGEYSVYRGPMGYEGPPPPQVQRLSGGGVPGGPVMAPGRNGHMGPPSGVIPGGIMLTQDNFRESPSTGHHQPYMGDQGPGGFGYYDQQNMGAAQYRNKPDVIMHVRQRSGDSAENSPHDRSFNTNPVSDPGARMRIEEVQMRNGQRISGGQFATSAQLPPNQRLSGGQLPMSGRMSPRPPQDMAPTSRFPGGGPTQFSPRNSDAAMSPPAISPRSTAVFSPTSPRGFEPGPVFSASNLESRVTDDDPAEQSLGGKPVAKVPPHMKAGIKVLPSDFRAVKLKPKAEKPPDTSEESGYDNNKQIMEKYKELQDLDSSHGVGLKPGPGRGSNYPDGDGFREFSNKGRFQEENRRDFMTQWQESVKDQRSGGVKHDDQVYRHSAGSNNYQQYEDNNNKNRYSVPSYGDDGQVSRQWGGGPKSQSTYDMGNSMQYSSNQDAMDPLVRMKDLEIASMFSNYRGQQQPSSGGRVGGDMHRPRDRNEFEEGLGYLP
ncbi:unnamed protein product [Lymnaea stagnalis]|uniref:Uncharacterized protein n=1 Tax=Lymnaea stagnalis TaxID=6523 RepID=A0AAV2H4Y5_LYMST